MSPSGSQDGSGTEEPWKVSFTITVPPFAGAATACGTATVGPAASSSAASPRTAVRIRPAIRSPVARATAPVRAGRA
ncbi:hypothetical protein Kpho01_54070 [Kitasatospora phosalacinea]|uniref:Uncharacterized protein n=1 Tax=Kitasatospora phosalacinea TaxID=2065 RepID=A0A9W6PLS9_9ACTN|nr:hypothetical protein Kpho01_54070 [Kitasatospora phosalacinea]